MPLSISDIIKQAAIEIGLEEPTGTLTTSSDLQIKLLLQAAVWAGRYVRSERQTPALKKLATITTTTATEYPLPGDFWKMISGTQWDTSNNWRMFGPLTDQQWFTFQYGIVSSTSRKRFRVAGYSFPGGTLQVDPAPANGDVLAFAYIRSQWFLPLAWAQGQTISGAGVYRSNVGNIYISTGAGTTGATPPTHTSGTVSDGGVSWTYVVDQLYGTNQKFQADTDFPLVDDDLMIVGVRARYLELKGLDFGKAMNDFTTLAAQRDIRVQGAPTLSLADEGLQRFLSYDNIPDGNYGQ